MRSNSLKLFGANQNIIWYNLALIKQLALQTRKTTMFAGRSTGYCRDLDLQSNFHTHYTLCLSVTLPFKRLSQLFLSFSLNIQKLGYGTVCVMYLIFFLPPDLQLQGRYYAVMPLWISSVRSRLSPPPESCILKTHRWHSEFMHWTLKVSFTGLSQHNG